MSLYNIRGMLVHPSYSHGAGDEARTRYLHLGKVALYRMSYTRGTRRIIADFRQKSILFLNLFFDL